MSPCQSDPTTWATEVMNFLIAAVVKSQASVPLVNEYHICCLTLQRGHCKKEKWKKQLTPSELYCITEVKKNFMQLKVQYQMHT